MRQLPGEWTSLVRGVGRKIASCKDHSEVGTGRTAIVRGPIAPEAHLENVDLASAGHGDGILSRAAVSDYTFNWLILAT